MPNWLRNLLFALLAVVLLGGVVVGIVAYENYRDGLKKDFRADAVAMGFVPTSAYGENPVIEDEDDGTSYIELLVEVNGCTVELSRKQGEKNFINRVNRKVEAYELDEGRGPGGREIEVEGAVMSPMPTDVAGFLTANKSTFDYCLAG